MKHGSFITRAKNYHMDIQTTQSSTLLKTIKIGH